MLWAVRGEVTLQSLPTWHDPVRFSGNTLDTTAQDRKIETSCYFKWTASQPALAKAQIVQRPSVVTDRITGAHCSIAPWGVCFRDPQWTPTFEIRAGGSTKSKHASCVQRPKILWNRCYCQGTKYRHHTGKGLVLMKWVPTSRKVLYDVYTSMQGRSRNACIHRKTRVWKGRGQSSRNKLIQFIEIYLSYHAR